ncbi:MAG: UbiD family decarboxylase domain-containing protein [Thermoprotei archaeon]
MSLRSFLSSYYSANPKDFYIADYPVNVDYEVTAHYVLLKTFNPIIKFPKLIGYKDFELVTNIMGDEKRVLSVMGVDSLPDAENAWNRIIREAGKPSYTTQAQVKQIVQTEDLDLFSLPIPRHFEQDGMHRGFGKYITGGVTTAKDPETGTINLSFTRIQPFSKNEFAFDAGSRGHLWNYLNKAKRIEINLEISVVIGLHPLLYLLAASFLENEYEKAASLIPLTLTDGIKNKIPVPADSEIVIEAEAIGEEFDEGPFSEYTGFVGQDSTKNVARVKSIFRRRKAIYYDIQPSNSNEHLTLFTFSRHSRAAEAISTFMPPGPRYSVRWPPSASNYVALASINKANPALAKQLGLLLLSSDPLFSKIVIVNEEDTPLTIFSSLANIAASYEASRVQVIKGLYSIRSNPTSEGYRGDRALIITQGSGKYAIKRGNGWIEIKPDFGPGSAIVSYSRPQSGTVRVQLNPKIPMEEEEITWALAMLVNPGIDVRVHKDYLSISASRSLGEIPSLPKDALSSALKKIENRSP